MANTASNVTAGKPAIGGAVFRGASGATLPTDATSTISTTTFAPLGYCSDDGLVNGNSPTVDVIKAWGTDPVLVIQNEKPDTFQLTLIEALNLDVLKAVYGSANVTGALGTGVTVKANSDEPEHGTWIVDMIMTGGVVKRITIPDGVITEVGDISYTDTDAVGYEITITALADSAGQTHYEYIKES